MAAVLHSLPDPPAFLDPLIDLDSCYYYTVPQFYNFHHPNTRWMIAMMKSGQSDRLTRKMDLFSESSVAKCFQMIDNPLVYYPDDITSTPMFNRKSVLYLTPLGMAIYLRLPHIVELLLNHRGPNGERAALVNEPQFATHVMDIAYGDFHSFEPFYLMIRLQCFEAAPSLMRNGWNSAAPVAMPLRRKYERRVAYFIDWLDAALFLLGSRSLFPIQSLINVMSRDFFLYKRILQPIEYLAPPSEEDRKQCSGFIEFEQLPPNVGLTGIRSLREIVVQYDKYLQLRRSAAAINYVKREAVQVGLNPEIVMMHTADYYPDQLETENKPITTDNANSDKADGYYNNANGDSSSNSMNISVEISPQQLADIDMQQQQQQQFNFNNAPTRAGASKRKKKNVIEEFAYSSECCRILHYALNKDKGSKSLHQCLDSVHCLVNRQFFSTPKRMEQNSFPARDVRNCVNLMLNLVQREQSKVDTIVNKLKSEAKKFDHVEERKLLESRKQSCLYVISKMMQVLTKILLQSKEMVHVLQSKFPPYTEKQIDFPVNPKIIQIMGELKEEIINFFNADKNSWQQLSLDMMKDLRDMPAVTMQFRVGNPPTQNEVNEALAKTKTKSKSKMRNSNNCYVTYKRIHRRRKSQSSTFSMSTISQSSIDSVIVSERNFDESIVAATASIEEEKKVNEDDATIQSSAGTKYTEILKNTDRVLQSIRQDVDNLLKPMEELCY